MQHEDKGRNQQSSVEQQTTGIDIGLRRGIRAFFDVDDITISFWGSAWTGLEVVRVDDRIVSRKRSLRFVTRHRFEHAGIGYEVVFRVISLLRGAMEIELYRNGELIDSDRARQNRMGIDPKTGEFSLWRAALQIAPFFIVGMAFGAGAALLVEHLTGG
jgi:hypothetical protein